MAEKRLVKRNGMLFEEDEPSLMDRVKQLGVTPPTTPGGAASIGATPDQAKMVGTPAQKKPILKEAVAKEQTLEGQQRLAAPRQATQQEQEIGQRAEQMTNLGGLSNRVQALVDSQLQQAAQAPQQASATANKDAVAAMLGLTAQQVAADAANPNSKYSQVLAKLQQYAQAPSEQALVDLTTAGLTLQQAEQAISAINTGASATGQAIAGNVADQVTLGTLDLAPLGFTDVGQLANALGVTAEQAQTMTVPQLQQKITEMQQQEFARVTNLKAQLASAPIGSAQRQLIEQQLAEAGQAGLEGATQKVAETAEDINLANIVKVGDRSFKVDELLKDENLSSLIEAYINAPADQKDGILPAAQFAGLRQWVDENQKALGDLVTTAQGTQGTFSQAQTDYKNLSSMGGLNSEVVKLLSPAFDPTKVVTSAQAAAAKAELSATPIGQIAASNDPAMAGLISKLTPDATKDLLAKGLNADQIKTAFREGQEIKNNPDLAGILGVDPTKMSDFSTDPALKAKYDRLRPVYARFKAAGDKFTTLLADKEFQQYVASGIDPETQQLLVRDTDPTTHFNEYKDYKKKKDAYAAAKQTGKVDSMLSFMFGDPNVNTNSLNKLYKSLTDIVSVDPTDKDAAKKLEYLNRFVGTDGVFGQNDLVNLDKMVGERIGSNDLKSFVTNKDKDYKFPLSEEVWAKGVSPAPANRAFFDYVKPLLADKAITLQEMNSLPEEIRNRLFDMPESWRKEYSSAHETSNDPDAAPVKIPITKAGYTKYASGNAAINDWNNLVKDNSVLLKGTGLDIKNTQGMAALASQGKLTPDQVNALRVLYASLNVGSSAPGAVAKVKEIRDAIAAHDGYGATTKQQKGDLAYKAALASWEGPPITYTSPSGARVTAPKGPKPKREDY